MTQSGRFDCELRTTLPATLAAIEDFFVEFRRRSNALMSRTNCFAAELLVREALTNAVLHGCGADPAKQVLCVLRLRGDRLSIAVADEGDGFDWRAARGMQTQVPETSGRGVEIYYRFADHVRFNKTGNAVTMFKRVAGGASL
jgi:anti-sigma regulatory factor (Ser/Thr protein kinase)